MSDGCTFEVFTIFPEVVDAFVKAGVLGKAIARGVVDVRATNIRDFAHNKHKSVDDTPFGGGAGMVMTPGPVVDAIDAVVADRGPMHRVLLTPSAPRFDQRAAERLATMPRIALVCGRYEGIDERVREHFIDECFSIGDYVLGGGEVAALVLIEAIARLVEGVLGNPASAVSESFSRAEDGEILEYPQFTRPAEFRGHRVPDVLMGGDHGAIARWRREAAQRRTWQLRPDLRPSRRVPADAPRWLAIDASQAGDTEALAAVALHHRVAGVALLGAAPEAAVAWAATTGGKVAAAAVASLGALAKRLKRRGGIEPWLVRLGARPPDGAPEVDELPHDAVSAGELADRLGCGATAEGRAIVLWLADPSTPPPPSVHASYAPCAQSSVAALRPGLAIPDAIDESRQPRQGPAVLADVALASLPTDDLKREEP